MLGRLQPRSATRLPLLSLPSRLGCPLTAPSASDVARVYTYVYVCMCICLYASVCVCACVYIDTITYQYIYILYIRTHTRMQTRTCCTLLQGRAPAAAHGHRCGHLLSARPLRPALHLGHVQCLLVPQHRARLHGQCTWVTSNAYSSPSIVLASTVSACRRFLYSDSCQCLPSIQPVTHTHTHTHTCTLPHVASCAYIRFYRPVKIKYYQAQ